MHPVFVILPAFTRYWILPPTVLLLSLRYAHPSHSYLSSVSFPSLILLCFLSVVAHLQLNLALKEYIDARERKRLGVAKVPEVKGWLPGNIDVMLNLFGKKGPPTFLGTRDTNLSREHGSTYNLKFLWKDVYFTTDPGNVKTILATNFDGFQKGPTLHQCFETFLGDGIFNSDGETWKLHRALSRPFFAKEKISDFDCFERHASPFLKLLSDKATSQEAFDIQDLFGRFTLDTSVDFLFGAQVNSIGMHTESHSSKSSSPSTERGSSLPFVHSFNEVQRIVTHRMKLGGIWPLFELFGDKTLKHMKVIHEFTRPILENALDKKRTREKDGELLNADADDEGQEGQSLLDVLLFKNEDLKFVQDELLNILLAARDTTSSLLTFVTYSLAANPKILARLREEILTVLGSSETLPTLSDIRSMKYLRAVINETLRLYPPVPGNMRESIGGAILPCADDGVPKYVPPGTPVNYVAFNTQRKKSLWGPDATTFDPDRWLDERVKVMTANPFIFQPFNAGPRICIGQQFAYNEASFLLVRFLQLFPSIQLARDAQPARTLRPEGADPANWPEEIWPVAEITLFSKGGLWVRLGTE